MSIGAKVRALREKHGWSQETLAGKIGVSQAYISYIENDQRADDAYSVIVSLAHVFDVSIDDLVLGEGRPRELESTR